MSQYGPRIAALERRYERDHEAFDPHQGTREQAHQYLREGAGQAIWLYIEARTGGRMAAFSSAEFDALERAMNGWFELYAQCHGVEIEAEFTVREAAEVLLDTRNIIDTTELLTQVPPRD